MKIKNATFVTSIADIATYNSKIDGSRPEIVFLGRSNVGKSSFLNMLTNQGKLAKTSATPGRTRLLNVFEINDASLLFIDVPGYGYAEASKKAIDAFSALIEDYLRQAKNLKQAFVLVDSRIPAQELDKIMLNYLYYYQIPFTIIATKADKLSKSQVSRQMMALSSGLGVGVGNIYPISSIEKTGKEAVLNRLGEILGEEKES